MSIRRLTATAAGMAVAAAALRALTPDLSGLLAGGLDVQRFVDVHGPESLLLSGIAALAWAIWAWGVLGLLLTALSGLPGMAGAVARAMTRGLLPAGMRRAAAVALGVGLVTGGPLLAGCTAGPAQPGVALAAATVDAIPDWPVAGTAPATESPGAVSDWPDASPTPGPPAPSAAPAPSTPTPTTPAPSAPASSTPAPPAPAPGVPDSAADAAPDWPLPARGDHVVLRGECLWEIVAADLRASLTREPADAEIAASVHAWWQANAAVIGSDPDLLLPGQVLRPPAR
ncbi:hypothetical protein ACI782_09355 [Geodermatophilus sp. SYSU D00703]